MVDRPPMNENNWLSTSDISNINPNSVNTFDLDTQLCFSSLSFLVVIELINSSADNGA
jgi:hypothetical protein